MTAYLSGDTTIANRHSDILTNVLDANILLKYDLVYELASDTPDYEEIFINAVPGFRLKLPSPCGAIFRYMGLGYDVDYESVIQYAAGFLTVSVEANGSVSRTQTQTIGVNTFEFLEGTDGEIICRVFGTGNTIHWRCVLDAVCLSTAPAKLRDGVYTGRHS